LSKKNITLLAEAIGKILEIESNRVEELMTVPPSLEMGDISLPCFKFSKELKKSPQYIVKLIKERLDVSSLPVREIKAVSGYINFFIDRVEEIKNVLLEIANLVSKYGSSDYGKGKTVVVEFSSPNVAKPVAFHHLRSTMIGNSISNILKYTGYKVIRINFIGDWGTNHGKLIAAFKKWGDKKKIDEGGLEYLIELYHKFEREKNSQFENEAREWFRKLERNDREAVKLWKRFRDISIDEFRRIYERLGVSFDSYDGESSVFPFMEEVIKDIDSKIKLKKSEGAEIVELDDENLPPVLIRKSDGATLYATRDIAEAVRRYKDYKFFKNLYVVATQQNLHFRSIFKVLSLMGYDWYRDCEHIAFGMMLFNDKKMATRSGNMIYLEDVMNKARDLAYKIIIEKNPELKDKEEVAEKVGVGSIIFNDLKNKRLKNVNFNWEEVLNFDGETGPYVQYTYARIGSIIRKAAYNPNDIKSYVSDIFIEQHILNEDNENNENNEKLFFEKLNSNEEILLAKSLSLMPQRVIEAAENYEPSIVSKYLLDMVSLFNAFYNKHRVISDDRELMNARMFLIYCVRQVIKNCAELLGLPLPERM